MTSLTDMAVVHQCAWCNGIMVDGIVVEMRAEKIECSHGICKKCKCMLLEGAEDALWSDIQKNFAKAN